MKVFKFIPLVLFGLSACSPQSPTAPSPSATQPTVPSAPVVSSNHEPAQVKLGDETFSLTSNSYRSCDAVNGALTVVARWDVRKLGVSEVSIFAEGPGSSKKLWLNGGATGASTTGNWVFNNSRFMLVERGTDKPLAEIEVVFAPCS